MDEEAKDGVLIYVKPLVRGDEPRDVLSYAQATPTFPHESVGGRDFSEAQFESYRALGAHVVEALCGPEAEPLGLAAFVERAEAHAEKADMPEQDDAPFKSAARVEEKLARLVDLISGPVLDNYEGALSPKSSTKAGCGSAGCRA